MGMLPANFWKGVAIGAAEAAPLRVERKLERSAALCRAVPSSLKQSKGRPRGLPFD